ELAGREVDAYPEVRPIQADLPVASLAAGLAEDPAADRDDVAGLLGEVDPFAGHEDGPVRRLPADEGLDSDDCGRAEVDDRLVVEAELVALLDAAEALGPGGPFGGTVTEARLEDLGAAARRLLRRVHRDVGVAEQVVGRLGAGPEGDADARRDPDRRLVERQGLPERLGDPGR